MGSKLKTFPLRVVFFTKDRDYDTEYWQDRTAHVNLERENAINEHEARRRVLYRYLKAGYQVQSIALETVS